MLMEFQTSGAFFIAFFIATDRVGYISVRDFRNVSKEQNLI